jgi:hypothetical protein
MRRAICCACLWLASALSLVECPGLYAQAAAQPPARAPQPTPLLPAEVAWRQPLEHALASTAAADEAHIYAPLANGQIVALSRTSGDVVWTAEVATRWPLIVSQDSLLATSESTLLELDRASGAVRRRHALPAPVTGRLTRADDLLLIPVQPSLLIAWRVSESREIWRQTFQAPVSVPPAVNRTSGLVIVSSGDRVSGLALSDGTRRWTTQLAGTLMEPIIVGDRAIVGSTSDDVYALDARGRLSWTWYGRQDVLGVTADRDQIYVASRDNIVHALKPRRAEQQWRKVVKTRLTFAPQLVGSTLLIAGIEPALTAFSTRGGDAGRFELPELAVLAAPPLILDGAEPDGVTMVLFTGHKEVLGLRRQPPKEEPEKNKDDPENSKGNSQTKPSESDSTTPRP